MMMKIGLDRRSELSRITEKDEKFNFTGSLPFGIKCANELFQPLLDLPHPFWK